VRGRRAVAATLAAVGCVLALSGPGEAAAPQRGLQALVDAAAPGDVVRPPAGTYAGPVVIRTPIVLDGGGDVTIDDLLQVLGAWGPCGGCPEDIDDDGSVEVLTEPDQFAAVKEAFVTAGHIPQVAEITMRASTTTNLEGDEAEKLVRLLDMLEELDDTQNVHCNAEIADEALES